MASGSGDPGFKNIEYLDTVEAYDRWSEVVCLHFIPQKDASSQISQVYDTDGNFLQALDTLEMQTLLPSFLSLVTDNGKKVLDTCKFIDLGCGTGRNTFSLRRAAPQATIVGLEPSSGMLDIARTNMAKHLAEHDPKEQGTVSFEQFNLLDPSASANAPRGADGIISTLVLEHVPTTAFFVAVANMLRPGGILLLTNMHSDMGAISQAGFVDPVRKVKIRPTSYAHTIEETVRAAVDAGLEVVGELKEQGVDEELAGKLGPRAKKWIGVKVWYGGCFVKK